MELRKTVLSKATLPVITAAIEKLCQKNPSPIATTTPSLESAVSSLFLYEKPESADVFYLCLSPVYRDGLQAIATRSDIASTCSLFFHDRFDASTLPTREGPSNTVIHAMRLSELELERECAHRPSITRRVHTWLRLSYQSHSIALQLPTLFEQVGAAEVAPRSTLTSRSPSRSRPTT